MVNPKSQGLLFAILKVKKQYLTLKLRCYVPSSDTPCRAQPLVKPSLFKNHWPRQQLQRRRHQPVENQQQSRNGLLLQAQPQLRPGYSAIGVNTDKPKATAAYRLEVD